MAIDKWIQSLRKRRGTSRVVLSGPVARRALGLATVVGVAGAIVGVFGAGPAAADPVSLTLRYTCSFLWIKHQPLTVKIDSDVPKSATVGKPAPRFVIDAAVPVSVAITKGLVRVGAKVVEGTVEAKIVVAAPQGDLDVIMPVDVKTNIPAFGPFYVKETGAVPALTFSRPGSAKITVGDLILHLTPKDASGNVVFPGKFRALCKLDAGQNNVVASFGITGTRTTTGSVTSGTVDTTTSGTTRSKTSESTGSPTDGTTRPATFGTSGTTTGLASGDGTWGMRRYMSDAGREGSTTDSSTGPPSSPRTTGGQDTEGLILLAVSTLVVAATFALALKIQRNRTI